MTNVFEDDFESLPDCIDDGPWSGRQESTGCTVTCSASRPHHNSYGIECDADDDWEEAMAWAALATPEDEFYFKLTFEMDTMPSNNAWFTFFKLQTSIFGAVIYMAVFRSGGANRLRIYNYGDSTTYDEAVGFADDTQYCVELRIKRGTSDGILQTKVNGTLWHDLTTIDTDVDGNDYKYFYVGSGNSSDSPSKTFIDCVIVSDSAWVGCDDTPFAGAVTYDRTVLLDILLQKTGIPRTVDLDIALQKTGIPKSVDLDIAIQKTGIPRTVDLDILLKALGVPKSVDLDMALKKLGIPKSVLLDILIKLRDERTVLLDIVMKALGVPKSVDLDIALQKTGIPRTVDLDIALQKIGIPKSVDLDIALKKTGIPRSVLLDIYLQVAGVTTYQRTVLLDILLKALGETRSVDLDIALQKTNIPKSILLDIYLSEAPVEEIIRLPIKGVRRRRRRPRPKPEPVSFTREIAVSIYEELIKSWPLLTKIWEVNKWTAGIIQTVYNLESFELEAFDQTVYEIEKLEAEFIPYQLLGIFEEIDALRISAAADKDNLESLRANLSRIVKMQKLKRVLTDER